MRSAISGEMAACSLSTRESAERPQDILTQRRAWVWGIEHATHKELLVRILVIDEYGIGAFEAKRQPPVAIDPNGEMPLQSFMKGMHTHPDTFISSGRPASSICRSWRATLDAWCGCTPALLPVSKKARTRLISRCCAR